MSKITLVLTAFLLTLVGCASTSVSTLRNPAIGNIAYSRILVSVPFQDIGLRRYAEYKFVKDFQDAGIYAFPAVDLLPPIKQYTPDEIKQVIEKNSIYAVMVVTLTDTGRSQSYVPQASQTSSSATVYGNSIYGTSRTTTSGGYYISKPTMNFEINLYDVKTGDVAWKATTFTGGNAYAHTDTMINSLADDVVKKYQDDSAH